MFTIIPNIYLTYYFIHNSMYNLYKLTIARVGDWGYLPHYVSCSCINHFVVRGSNIQ